MVKGVNGSLTIDKSTKKEKATHAKAKLNQNAGNNNLSTKVHLDETACIKSKLDMI